MSHSLCQSSLAVIQICIHGHEYINGKREVFSIINTMSSTTFVCVYESLHNVTGSRTVNTCLLSKCPSHLIVWMCTSVHAGVYECVVWHPYISVMTFATDCCLIDINCTSAMWNQALYQSTAHMMRGKREKKLSITLLFWQNLCYRSIKYFLIISLYSDATCKTYFRFQISFSWEITFSWGRCIRFLYRLTTENLFMPEKDKIVHAHFALDF